MEGAKSDYIIFRSDPTTVQSPIVVVFATPLACSTTSTSFIIITMTSPIASTSYRALSLSLRSCPPLHLAFPKPRFYASLSHQPQKLVSHQVPLVLAATQDKGKGKAVEDMTAEAATQSHVTPPPRVPRRTVGLKGKKAPITMVSHPWGNINLIFNRIMS